MRAFGVGVAPSSDAKAGLRGGYEPTLPSEGVEARARRQRKDSRFELILAGLQLIAAMSLLLALINV